MMTVPIRELLMKGEWTPPVNVIMEHLPPNSRIIVDCQFPVEMEKPPSCPGNAPSRHGEMGQRIVHGVP